MNTLAPAPVSSPGVIAVPISREQRNATCRLGKFAWLSAQLCALLLVIRWFNVESTAFFYLSVYCYAGFALHYIMPFRLKKYALVAVALVAGGLVLAQPDPSVPRGFVYYAGAAFVMVAAMLFALCFFAVLRLRASFGMRVSLLVLMGAALMYCRYQGLLFPDAQWRIIGTLFMFRMILVAYEVRIGKQPERLQDFLSYIFLPPNFYFLLFPVIDYSTFKKSWYVDDIHATAQRGISWIVRGVIQLCLYRFIYHRLVIGPSDVRSFWSLLHYILPAYLMYMRISGQFHIIVGMLHLFGYKLPETNRKYLLAESFTDFWRRINIYWKDFMIKVFYYPAYFRLRKKNETLALTVATVWVFIVTTLLHGYQWFWIQGRFTVTTGDLVFWPILGVLVWATVLYEMRRGPRKPRQGPAAWATRVACTLGVYLTISVLWSMWSADSVGQWVDTVTYWR